MNIETLARFRHDIGTFLNHIIGFCDLLKGDTAEDASLVCIFEQIRTAALELRLPLMAFFSDKPAVDVEEPDETAKNRIFTLIFDIVSLSQTARRLLSERGFESLLPDIKRVQDAANGILGLIDEKPSLDANLEPEAISSSVHGIFDLEGEESAYHGRLLVVDDDQTNRYILKRNLERMGHVVCVAENGQDALEILKKVPFDILIMDVMMPKMNGFQLLRQVKEDECLRTIMVIVVSSLADSSGIARCIRLGAEDYLPRDFELVILQARIDSCLERKRLRESEVRSLQIMMDAQRVLASELAEAADYVRTLLPRRDRWNHVVPDWLFLPSLSLGGDIFSYHELSDGKLALFLIDVSGHGIEAALVSVTLMNILKTQALPDVDFSDPASVLKGLNASFKSEEQNNLFFTAWYGVYDPASRTLAYVSAGSPPAILSEPDGACRELSSGGMIVGVDPAADYTALKTGVTQGSSLFLFSDGIFELRTKDGLVLSWESFVGILKEVCLKTRGEGSSVLTTLAEEVKVFCGKQRFDDDASALGFYFDA